MSLNNIASISSQSNPIKTNVLRIVKEDTMSLGSESPLVNLTSIIDPRLPVDPFSSANLDSEVVEITGQITEAAQEKEKGKADTVLSVLDLGMDIIGASAKIIGSQDVSAVVDKAQLVNKIVMGSVAAEEGKFSLNPQHIVSGTYKEQVGLGKSTAFVATCLSATLQAGSAIANAVGGETLTSVASACNDYVVPAINKGIKSPALLFSYCANYHNQEDVPEDTEEEKNLKQVQRGNTMLKAGIAATKLASTVISVAAPTVAISATLATPLAVATIGTACLDGYLIYQNLNKKS